MWIITVNGTESASKEKYENFHPTPPREQDEQSLWFWIQRMLTHCSETTYNYLSLSYFKVFFNVKPETLSRTACQVGQECYYTYHSLSHKSSILWLCIYDTWPVFLPCDCLLRDKRGLAKHSASLTGNISHIPLCIY